MSSAIPFATENTFQPAPFAPDADMSVTVESANVIDIPDFDPMVGPGYATDSVSVDLPADALISDLEVGLDIDHSFASDLYILLTGPDGSTSSIVDPLADPNAVFEPTPDGLHVTVATDAFDGMSADGTWTLTVIDEVAEDVGTLTDWSLSIGGDAVEMAAYDEGFVC